MEAQLALAIEACVVESTALLVSLVKKINEVRKLKKKCEALGKQAKILVELLDKNSAAITTFQTVGQFKACLHRIDAFVSAVSQSSLMYRTMEVFWRNEYQSITADITWVKGFFVAESVVGAYWLKA